MIISPSTPARGPVKAPEAPAGNAEDALRAGPSNQAWNWNELADQSGFVDVILWSDSQASAKDVTARITSAFGIRTSSEASMSSNLLDVQIKSIFKYGLNGVSAKIKPIALQQLLASDASIRVYPDLQVHAMDSASDQQIGADQIWTRTDTHGSPVTGTGITVAVIDTGVFYTHPDLGGGFGPGHKVIGGYDFFNNDPDPMDDNGHGTHVAGIIAGSGGIEGVAPGASIMAYKVLGADGSGPMSNVIEAIDASIDPNNDGITTDHLQVISMSLGGSGSSQDPICMAVKRAVDAGIVVVVAAGNSGPSVGTVASPGVSPYAVTVGAVDDAGALANFSSRGPTADMLMKPEISAPGVNILSTVPYSGTTHSSSTGYMTMSGTSMATPHVSGAAALLIQLHPTWTPQQVKSALVTGARNIGESFWSAGAGEVWLPSSADTALFSSQPLVSYGIANGTLNTVSILNLKQAATFTVRSVDWGSLSADGSLEYHQWSNISRVSPTSISIGLAGTGSLTLTVSALPTSNEGYFDGAITLSSGSATLVVPFGFMVLTKVTVHVRDNSGREVFDPYGGVWIYSVPGAEVAISRRGSDECSPPATFLLPSGQYSVHAAGHQLIYSYGDPYLLSKVFTLTRLQTSDVWLNMTDAHKLSVNLETSDGLPIYVKEFRVYARYTGTKNFSFDLTGSDYSITGAEVFTIPHSISVYVSDTQATVGISIQGFAYSSGMWDFMKLNWQHWYEYITGSSNSFMVEASADQQYLLAWEFPGVDSSIPSVLTYDPNSSRTYVTKYDIPGTITDPWCNWDTHRAIGGGSAFYVRRDTDTSLNPFLSGLNRTTLVSGVFSELYFPTGIFSGYFEREFYTPDYSHLLRARTASNIFLPDRNFLTPLPASSVPIEQRLGVGPFYPSVYTINTDSTMVLFNPLLRDQWGSKIGGMNGPMMHLYLGGAMVGTYQLSEFLARPDAERIVSLMGPGSYVAKIDYSPLSQLFNNVEIDLGFSVPSTDPDPPLITGLSMPQRFVPGAQLGVSVSAEDLQSDVSIVIKSRAGEGAAWVSLPIHSTTPHDFTSTIQTSAGDSVVDLMINVKDSAGNFVNYTAYSVAKSETPVVFELQPSVSQVEFKNSGVSVVLSGRLTDASGNPLHPTAGVPLELMVDGRKVGVILDEYVSGATHLHNGAIQFDWVLTPTQIFSSVGETVNVRVTFDLGTYSSITRTFQLTSIPDTNTPPVIELNSPRNATLISAGTPIDLSIRDDGMIVSSGYSVDGTSYKVLSSPWDIGTSSWSEASHVVRVYAVDDDGSNVSAQYDFEVDAYAPTLSIRDPSGPWVPLGSTLVVEVSDTHLSGVSYSLDNGQPVTLPAPYTVNMTTWSLGLHSVEVTATDAVGHVSTASASFTILNSTVILRVLSPSEGSVIKSGVPITLEVSGSGVITCSWSEAGVSHALSSPYVISTDGWSEGAHQLTISASNDIGGHYQTMLNLTFDNTPPSISLQSPLPGTLFVTNDSYVVIGAWDPHFKSLSWTIAGLTASTTSATYKIPLSSVKDGYFSIIVIACDRANNTEEKEFMFGMDSNAPQVSFVGASSGGTILPGAPLSLTASDVFLSDVRLSVDGGAWRSVTVPYSINTSEVALGWHSLAAIAEDHAGHSRNENITIYIDGTPPVISMMSKTNFRHNESFNVSATVTDDHGIGAITLYYTLPGGGFGSMPMTMAGTTFVATLSPDQLWDGVVVYVVVTDFVGNSVEGEHQTLHAVAHGPGGMTAAPFWLFTAGGAGSIAIVVVSAFILLFFVQRRRETEDEILENPAPARKPVGKITPSFVETAKRAAGGTVRSVQPLSLPVAVAQAAILPKTPPERTPAAPAPAPTPKREPFSLLDAIPAVRLRAEEMSEAGYRAFMAQLEGLQKDITALQRKRSVYPEPEVLTSLDFEEDLGLEKPKVIKGLQLKTMMH